MNAPRTFVTEVVVEAAVEAPHLVYPRGPIRKIATFREAEDAVAGTIVLVTLGPCGHQATLVGPHLSMESLVRCPICFYEKHRGGHETIIDTETRSG